MAKKIHSTVIFGEHSTGTVVSDSKDAIEDLNKNVPGSTSTGDGNILNYGDDVLSSYDKRKKLVSTLSKSCYRETGSCETSYKSNGKFSVLLLIGTACIAAVGIFLFM